MKKFFACVVKILVVVGMVAGAMFAVVRYWDSIMEFVEKIKSLFRGKKREAALDDADFADWVD